MAKSAKAKLINDLWLAAELIDFDEMVKLIDYELPKIELYIEEKNSE